jgi:hypothetical protein
MGCVLLFIHLRGFQNQGNRVGARFVQTESFSPVYRACAFSFPLLSVISNADRKVSEAMMTIWTQFARTGNPSVKGLVEWPAWDKTSDQYLDITEPLQVKSGYSDLVKIKAIRSSVSL